jgi:hypothetical protein
MSRCPLFLVVALLWTCLAAGAARAAAATPDPSLTPGATNPAVTQETIATTICRKGYASSIRNVTSATKQQVFAAYGVPKARERLYVIDHLVPLEVGGANIVANLWPEPKAESKVKDKEEDALHDDVCRGALALGDAQRLAVGPVETGLAAALRARGAVRGTRSATTTAPVPVPAPATTLAPAPAPGGAGSAPVVHPGAFCAPVGARGVTSAGTPMVCGRASDGRNRWHSG